MTVIDHAPARSAELSSQGVIAAYLRDISSGGRQAAEPCPHGRVTSLMTAITREVASGVR